MNNNDDDATLVWSSADKPEENIQSISKYADVYKLIIKQYEMQLKSLNIMIGILICIAVILLICIYFMITR